MGLDDLKRKKQEEKKREVNEELRKHEEQDRFYSEIAESSKIDLPHLQAIEESFWVFAEKFSSIIGKSCSQQKKILGLFRKSAIKTRESYGEKRPCYPELYVSFYEPDNSTNKITLIAKERVLYFEGKHFTVHSVGNWSSVSRYGKHEANISLNNFEKNAVIKWIEEQFLKYHDEYIEGIKEEKRRHKMLTSIT